MQHFQSHVLEESLPTAPHTMPPVHGKQRNANRHASHHLEKGHSPQQDRPLLLPSRLELDMRLHLLELHIYCRLQYMRLTQVTFSLDFLHAELRNISVWCFFA